MFLPVWTDKQRHDYIIFFVDRLSWIFALFYEQHTAKRCKLKFILTDGRKASFTSFFFTFFHSLILFLFYKIESSYREWYICCCLFYGEPDDVIYFAVVIGLRIECAEYSIVCVCVFCRHCDVFAVARIINTIILLSAYTTGLVCFLFNLSNILCVFVYFDAVIFVTRIKETYKKKINNKNIHFYVGVLWTTN